MTPYARGASLALHHLKLAGIVDKLMPEGASLSNEGDHFQWKTPGGHTIHMPYRNDTIQQHQDRLGRQKAKELLHTAVQRESANLDKEVDEAQKAYFNQHPRLRNGLIGGTLGGTLGAIAGGVVSPRHSAGWGALAGGLGGAALGIGLSQIGKPSQRLGPETHDFTDNDPRDLPQAFYHLTPQERRHLEHMDTVDQYFQDATWYRDRGRAGRNRENLWDIRDETDWRYPQHY